MTEHGGTYGQPTADGTSGVPAGSAGTGGGAAGGGTGGGGARAERTGGAPEFDLTGSGARPLQVEDPAWIGDIPLLGRLGSGGTGRVYLGLLDGEYVAVKQVHPHLAGDQTFLRRFGRELDDLARLPADGGAAPLLAGDPEARPPWLATRYVPGLTLGQALELNGGPFAAPAVRRLLHHLAGALRELHARELVHGDLKPSNVMLTEEGVTLIDVGLARAAGPATAVGPGPATPAYPAPEQAADGGESTPGADVFALGSLLALAATGQHLPPAGVPGLPAAGVPSSVEVPSSVAPRRPATGERPSVEAPFSGVPGLPAEGVPSSVEVPSSAAPRRPGAGERPSVEAPFSGVPGLPAAGVPSSAEEPPSPVPHHPTPAERPSVEEPPSAEDRSPTPQVPPRVGAGLAAHLAALRERDAEAAELVAACLDEDPAARPTTQDLLDLAAPHTADAARSWPAPVQDRLVGCAAFVARSRPLPDQLPVPPEASSGTLAIAQEEPAPEQASSKAGPGRRRALFVSAAVLLAAGIPLGMQLLPDSSPATGASSRPGTSAPQATVPGTTTPASPAAPASRATPSDSPRPDVRPAAPGTTATGTPGPAVTASGSASDAGSATPTTPTTASPSSGAPTGSAAYRNAKSDSCLTSRGLGNSLALGSCSGDAAQWTLAPVPGGYHLVNEATSRCLQAGRLTSAASLAGCDSTDSALTWSPGPTGSLSTASDGTCLYVSYFATAPSGINTATCDTSTAQTWQRG